MAGALVPSLLDWFAACARDLPWRRTRDPYAIWVSEIMLQQTQVKTVIPYFERWMRELPTIESLAGAPSARIHKLWEGLGYYTRVRNMQTAARTIVESHGGAFPQRHEDVLALPGIGPYTAGAICSIAFNQPQPVLDGNVIRVLTRVFGIRESVSEKPTQARLWALAGRLVATAPAHESRAARGERVTGACSALNQALMELGATVCTPNPDCAACPVARRCEARRTNSQRDIPNLEQRAPSTARRFVAFVAERNGTVLVRQRPENIVNGLLWEFPNAELKTSARQPVIRAAGAMELGGEIARLEHLCTIRHTITRYRMTLEVFKAHWNGRRLRPSAGRWVDHRQLRELAFSSAHRRIADKLIAQINMASS